MKSSSVGLLSGVVAVVALLVNVSAALAQSTGADPTKIGDNVKGIASPNAKAFWWIIIVVTLLIAGASRRMGKAAGVIGLEVVAGIVIYNPVGVGAFMQNVASSVLH